MRQIERVEALSIVSGTGDDILIKLRDLPIQGREQQLQLQKSLAIQLKKLERQQLKASREGFKRWISNSLRMGAGALHRFTKTFGQEQPGLSPEYASDGKRLVEPLDIIQAKGQYWSDLWQGSNTPVAFDPWWEQLKAAALREERDELTLDELKGSLKCFKTVIGMGADSPNPHWWKQSPDASLGDLLEVLRSVEKQAAWPEQVCLNMVALLYKSPRRTDRSL